MADTPSSRPDLPPETPLDSGSQALSEALRSSFTVVRVVMVLLVVVFLGSGFFTVEQQERAIKLHFGRAVGLGEGEKALLGPGLQWSLPYPIDEHVKVSITGIQQVRSTIGWYATTPEQELAGTEPPAGGSLNPAVDGYTLTADNNIVHTRVTLTYRIKDPVTYVFSFVNASNAVQNALDNSLLFAASHFTIDDILYKDVLGFREAVRKRVTELVDKQGLGIAVEQCSVQRVPPRQLKDAFDSVLKAEVNRSKVLNDARSDENKVLSKAGADASSRTNLAESDRVRLVNDVSSRADQFKNLLPKFNANPSLFARQRLTDTLGRVFTNAQDKIFLAESPDGRSKQLRLLLNREPPKKPEEQKPQ
jgi:membrane protease subunit HflK